MAAVRHSPAARFVAGFKASDPAATPQRIAPSALSLHCSRAASKDAHRQTVPNALPQCQLWGRQFADSNLNSTSSFARACSGTPRAGSVRVSCSSQRLSDKFEELKQRKEVALIPFIVAGDPDLETTAKALKALVDNGADIIELGVPYSDPLADGPVIQAASARALEKGTDLQSVLDVLAQVSPSLSAPVVLFTYFNPIMKRGMDKFMQDAKTAGAAGLVVPDVPLEETGPLREAASKQGLQLVLLTTPTTPKGRMNRIAEATQGFLYLVSLTGVTGARTAVEGRVQNLLSDIKEASDKPVAVGFGISRPEHVEQVISWGADGVIVGSAIVRLLGESSSPEQGLQDMVELMKSLKKPCMSKAVA